MNLDTEDTYDDERKPESYEHPLDIAMAELRRAQDAVYGEMVELAECLDCDFQKEWLAKVFGPIIAKVHAPTRMWRIKGIDQYAMTTDMIEALDWIREAQATLEGGSVSDE